MKKAKLEVVRINEDVIATSTVCSNNSEYHLFVAVVDAPNSTGGVLEKCLLYTNGDLTTQVTGSATDVSSLPNNMTFDTIIGPDATANKNSFYLQLGSPNLGDTYYWNGSSWVKCDVTHVFPKK